MGGKGGGGFNIGGLEDIARRQQALSERVSGQQMDIIGDMWGRSLPLRDLVFSELESLLTGQPGRRTTTTTTTPMTMVPGASPAPAMAPTPGVPAAIPGPDGSMVVPDPEAYANATTTLMYTDPATGQSWPIQVPAANTMGGVPAPTMVPGTPETTVTEETLQPSILRGVFAPARDALELQYQAARRAIEETSPSRGGQLNRQLGDLTTQRARSVAGLEADLLKNAFQLAYGISTGTPGQALSGLSSINTGNAAQTLLGAGGLQAQQNALAAQQGMALGQGLGQLAGMGAKGAMTGKGLGSALGGAESAIALSPAFLCWVADALYGEGSIQARLARLWVSEGWQGPAADAFRAVYRRLGPPLARLIRQHPWLGHLVRPLFDRFVSRGWDDYVARLTAVCRG